MKPDGSDATVQGNCGVCAAPKLLMAAQANNLVPVSMAEFWVGSEKDGWTEGSYIDSCAECMTIVGTMMCGIEKKTDPAPDGSLAKKLGAVVTG